MYWVHVLHHLQRHLSGRAFNNWFKSTLQVHEDPKRVVVLIPSPFFREVIERSYLEQIEKCIEEAGLPRKQLQFMTNEEWEADQIGQRRGDGHPRLNPMYTFENFVVGSSNQAAYAAARAVADHPGTVYNPLFIYGGVGLGKTHLLHAIGNFVHQENPSLNVIYVSGDALMNHLVEAYRQGTVHEMRRFYRNSDVLLLDDVHTLGGKERTQEELFSLFNILHQSNKQIILTADQPPQRLTQIEKRLISRFSWGLVVDIQPPELEVRIAILQKKAQLMGFQLPDDVALFIAERVTGNVRLLEGALKGLIFHASMRSQPITLDLAQKAIDPMVDRGSTLGSLTATIQAPRIDLDGLTRVVAEYFNITPDALRSRSHRPKVVLPRQIVMYLARNLLNASYPEIGSYFGRHHTTVMHAVQKIEDLTATNPKFHEQLQALIGHIHNL